MTDDDFQGLFAQDDVAELQAAAEAAISEVKPVEAKKDGIWYTGDTADVNGHAISWYAVNMGGKTVLWFSADNDLEAPAEELAKLGKLPAGITGHALTVWNAARTNFRPTTGYGLRAPHPGQGTHIDGKSVQSYVLPRLPRFLGELYGV